MIKIAVLLALSVFSSRVAYAAHRVLCLGDSITEGYGVAREAAFPAVVSAFLKAKGVKDVVVINAGVSGSTSASGISRLRWHLKGEKPEVLVLSLGSNDGLRGIDPTATKANLVSVITAAKAAGLKVLLTGMQMPPNMGPAYTTRFASVYTDIAKAEKVVLMPFLLDGVGGEPAMNQADGIHPNEKGHQVIAKNLVGYLEPLLKD